MADQRTTPDFRGLEGLRIALFGGSFDPIHAGHRLLATTALEMVGLDLVVFVPAHQNPLKSAAPGGSSLHRLRMLELVVATHDRFRVSTWEMERSVPSYTIDTIEAVNRDNPTSPPEMFLILGSDQIASLHRWRDAHRLIAQVQPILFRRDGAPALSPDATGDLMKGLSGEFSEGERNKIFSHLIPFHHPASSTAIRAALAHGDRSSVQALLDPEVADYISTHRLYGC